MVPFLDKRADEREGNKVPESGRHGSRRCRREEHVYIYIYIP